MILTRTNLIYLGFALLIGMAFSFGLSSITYHPVPLQVKEDPYQPLAPPTPSVTILAPQHIPGSSADANNDTSKDPYAPAPAPVVVTTQPLPSITPIPSSNTGTGLCANSQWNKTIQSVYSQTQSAFVLASILPFLIIGVSILMIILGIFGHGDLTISTSPFNTSQAAALRSLSNGSGGSLIGIIIAVGGVLIALYIITVIIGRLSSALTMGC